MGNLFSVGTHVQNFGVTATVVTLVALGLFSFFSADKENDDDDSTPGGGLMQPVA